MVNVLYPKKTFDKLLHISSGDYCSDHGCDSKGLGGGSSALAKLGDSCKRSATPCVSAGTFRVCSKADFVSVGDASAGVPALLVELQILHSGWSRTKSISRCSTSSRHERRAKEPREQARRRDRSHELILERPLKTLRPWGLPQGLSETSEKCALLDRGLLRIGERCDKRRR